jgi:HAD superfamily hydrolase (TIGR01509 family)
MTPRRVTAVALDFDGVVCDSIEECLRLSYAVFREVEHGDPADVATLLDAAPPSPLSACFLERRGIVRPAAHYYLLWKWLSDFPDRPLSTEEFEAMALDYGDRLRAFHDRFFRYRSAVRERNPDAWLRLNPPFPGVVAAWPRLRRQPLYIVTTKDRGAVTQFLDAHHLPATAIFAAGEFTDKGQALATIASREGCDPQDVLFVDDNASHLADAARAGTRIVWAAWGYDRDAPAGVPAVPDFTALVDLVDGGATSPVLSPQRSS